MHKLALKTHLDLLQHLAHKSIDQSKHYVFNNASRFRRIVAVDGAYVLHLLAHIVRYNIKTNNKVATNYAKWEKINQDHNKAL